MTVKVYKREAVFIPIKDISAKVVDRVKEKLSFRFYEEKACLKCENLPERPNDICATCAAYKGGYDLGSVVKVKDNKYLKIPVGSSPQILEYVNRTVTTKIVDKTPRTPIKPIKFTGTLKPEQVPAVNAVIAHRRGVLKAPPRSGKCVDGSTMISTNSGLVRIDSLFQGLELSKSGETVIAAKRGLKVHTPEGFRTVRGLYSKVVDQTISLTTELGKKLLGTPNHPVRVVTKNGLAWRAMEDLRVGDFVVSNHADGWGGTGDRLLSSVSEVDARVPKAASNILRGRVPTKMTEDLAAVLGFLTADGRCGSHPSLGIANSSTEKLQQFQKAWDACFPDNPLSVSKDQDRCPSIGTSCAYVRFFIEEQCGWPLENAGEKEIPRVLLGTDRKFIVAYLGAYMTCDGEINKADAVFSSASFKFARQLSMVLSCLGIRNRSVVQPMEVELDHVTLGKRTGKYGCCKMKRHEFDQLVHIMGDRFYRPNLVGRDPRLVDQSDKIPFLRESLIGLEHERQFRIGQKYFMRTQSGWKVRTTKFIRDRRGPGRSAHVNRAGLGTDRNSAIRQFVFLDDGLKEISKRVWATAKQLVNPKICFEEVVSIEVLKKPTRVYDLEVPSNHQFFGNGLLCHNTVMATAIACQLGVKTLILASQRDWLMGFQETFIGSKTQVPLTDLKPSRIKLCKTLKDFQTHDVCMATVQTFYSEGGEKILEKIRDMFEFVVCDEVHTSAADKYIRILSKLNFSRGLGLSGTPSRKDSKYVLVENILGPIVHEVEVKGERPELRLTRTKYVKDYKGNVPWSQMVSGLENDPKRLKLMAETAIKDVEAGHMLLIPLSTVKPIAKLVALINKKAGKKLAFTFTGSTKKKDRDEYIQKAREYKIKILVGTMKILSTGINIPRASCLYEASMSSNKENAEQRMRRVLTPMEGKPRAIIRYFLDNANVRRNCLRNEYFQVMLPKIKPIVSDKNREILKTYFNERQAVHGKFEL